MGVSGVFHGVLESFRCIPGVFQEVSMGFSGIPWDFKVLQGCSTGVSDGFMRDFMGVS